MVRIAGERISDLFALAEREATGGDPRLAGRYVQLARRIGMRYNVRLLPEYRELYCRSCSTFWVEGRTVRTRFRSGRRVRTCLLCERARRVPVRRKGPGSERPQEVPREVVQEAEGLTGPVEPVSPRRFEPADEGEEE